MNPSLDMTYFSLAKECIFIRPTSSFFPDAVFNFWQVSLPRTLVVFIYNAYYSLLHVKTVAWYELLLFSV